MAILRLDEPQGFIDGVDHVLVTQLDKLDVEGSEIDVLKGASRKIETLRPHLADTIHHRSDQYVEVPYSLIKHLQGFAFSVQVFRAISRDSVIHGTPL